MSADLPRINSLVRIGVTEDILVPSRVEGVDGLDYAVATPSYAGDLEHPQPGTALRMTWTSQRGFYGVPVEYVGSDRDRVSLWLLRVTGEVQAQQRRSYVRVELSGTVAVAERRGAWVAGTARTGSLLDLSEGALRARLAQPLEPGDVMVTLSTADSREQIPGRVVRTARADGDDYDVVLAFDEEAGAGDTIRHLVVREQLRARRAARD